MGSESGPRPRRHCGKGQRRSRALSIDLFSVLTVVRVRPVRPLCSWYAFALFRSPVACLDCGMRAPKYALSRQDCEVTSPTPFRNANATGAAWMLSDVLD
jgi:hypothetical protein